MLQDVADRALAAGVPSLRAHSTATDRNRPAASLYPSAGFVERGRAGHTTYFELPLAPRPQLAPSWIGPRREAADG